MARFPLKTATCVELFAGAGGLALGLQQGGLSVRALVERDRNCCATLRRNAPHYFPEAAIVETDITRMSVPEFVHRAGISRDDVDVVSGGPPCQSFSISKIPKGGRVSDPRDELLLHFVRYVKGLKPRLFLFENVPGLLSRSDGRIFRDLSKQFFRIGYAPNVGIINAADFGVPQFRNRLFVLGCSDGHEIDFPSPTHSADEVGLPHYLAIGDVLTGLSSSLPNNRIPKNTTEKKKLLARMRPGSPWTHWRHRDRWNEPSRCLTAHCRDEWVHPKKPRSASVRELATLQTFPGRYEFCGPVNSCNNSKISFQYRQVGNAVPPSMAKVLGRTAAGHLDWC